MTPKRPAPTPGAPNSPSARPLIATRRILICDHNKQKFADFVKALAEADIEVKQVDDRNTVLQTALDYQPDLILINLFLNSAHTLGLIREVKTATERQGTKIIVLTSQNSRENIMECIKSGASDFIIEPFDSRQLLQRVKYQLQDREAYSPDDLKAEPTQVLAGFQLLYDCLRILSEVRETHKSVFEVLKRLADISKSPRVNLILADVNTNLASVIASSDDESMSDKIVDLEKYPEVREVVLKNTIVYIKDITQNPLTKDIKKNLKDIDITSLLVFPIRHRSETLGTLAVRLSKDGLEVSDKHLKSFYMIALCLAPKVAAKKLMKKMESQK